MIVICLYICYHIYIGEILFNNSDLSFFIYIKKFIKRRLYEYILSSNSKHCPL